MMVIGLFSGKEIIVQDQSYFITVGDAIKQVFISPDEKRRYVVAENRIEYYDEVHSTEYMDKIHTAIKTTKEKIAKPNEDTSYV